MIPQRFMNEIFQHGLGNIKIRDHPVLHRADRHNIARGTADHLLGFRPDLQHLIRLAVHRHHRRLPDNNAFPLTMHQRVCRAQIDPQIMGKVFENSKHKKFHLI